MKYAIVTGGLGFIGSFVATEEHPTNPKEIYGTMKLTGENVIRGLSNFISMQQSSGF